MGLVEAWEGRGPWGESIRCLGLFLPEGVEGGSEELGAPREKDMDDLR